jgi:3-phenylpropionate/trans-cinnamate dioxygenase ferredoxin component
VSDSIRLKSEDVVEGRLTAVTLEGQPLILTRWQGVVYALSARCPHASGNLAEGELYRGRLDCPDHGYRFDLRSGRCLWPPDEVYRLRQYETEEKAGAVIVRLPKRRVMCEPQLFGGRRVEGYRQEKGAAFAFLGFDPDTAVVGVGH